MADRYWVGGTGNWSNTARWSTSSGGPGGASVPTASDNVIFDSLSHTTSYTVTIDASTRSCLSFTASAPLSGNLTLAGTQELQISGSLTWYTGMIVSYTGTMRFISTTTGNTIDTKNISFSGSVTLDGVGGAWTLASAYTQPSNTFTLTNGSFSTSTFAFSVRRFASNNTNIRTLNLGSGNWTITGNGTTVIDVVSTNLTVLSGGSTITCTYSGGTGTRSIVFSSGVSGNEHVKIYVTGGTDTVSLGTLNFHTLDFTGFAGTIAGNSTIGVRSMLMLSTGCTVTYTGTISMASDGATLDTKGKTLNSPITLAGQVSASYMYLPSGLTNGSTRAISVGANAYLSAAGKTLVTGSLSVVGSGLRGIDVTGGSLTLTGTGTVFSSTSTGTPVILGQIIVSDTSATQKTITTPGLLIPDLVISGDNVLINNTCTVNALAVNTAGRTTGLVFTAGITVTVQTFTSNGYASNLAKMSSATPGSPFNIKKISGYINEDYLSITDSVAFGGATFYAGGNSTNGGGNSGWIFSGLPLKVTINGNDMTGLVLWKSIQWKPAITNKVDTFSFSLYKFGSRSYTPALFDSIEFYDGGVLVFSGSIIQSVETVDAVDRQLFSITCKDHTHSLDRRLVVERYTEKPIINIVCDILNRYVNKGSRIEIATFEENEIWIGGTADTVNYRIADQGLKITSTNAVLASAYRDLLVDLEPSGYSSSDYIEIDVYVDDVTKLGSASMILGDATLTNYYSASITSQLTATGWNLVRVAKSSFSATGSITWSTIARIKLEVTSIASNTVNVTFDNWQEVKTTAFTRNGTNASSQVIKYIACNYEEPSKVFQRMADMWKMQWYVTPEKDIKFFARFDDSAPFSLSDTSGNYVYNSLLVNSQADQIRNGIFVRGADYLSGERTDNLKVQADGINKIFVLGYKYAEYSLEIDGVPQAIGIDNINGYTDNNGSSQLNTGGTAMKLGDAAARTKRSQQVIVSSSGKRSKITLRIRKVGAPVDNFQVQIFTDSANTPSATALSSISTQGGAGMTTSYVEYTFTLSPINPGDLTLEQPTLYHIVCSRSGANDAANYYEIDAVPRGRYEGVPNVFDASWSVDTSVMYFTEKIDFDVLFSFNEKILTFSSAPSSSSDILWTGKPYLPINVRYSDATSVTEYGDYEYRIIDKSIKTQEGARQRANAELLSFAQGLQDVSFTTYRSGLSVGQTITIQSAQRGIDLNLIIMGITAKAKSPTSLEYKVTCALTKTMGIIYWLQDQIAKDSRDLVIDDNELFDRVDSLSETVYIASAYASETFTGKVWSNDALSTPNALVWSGGIDHIWI